MSSPLFKSCCMFLTILTVIALSEALKCHQCLGAGEMPSAISPLLNQLNVNNVTICDADCETGAFCLKVAYVYNATINGTTYHHTTYTKTCSSLKTITPFGGAPTNIQSGKCYMGAPGGQGGSVAGITKYCFCNNGDKCNSAVAHTGGVISVVLSVIALLAFH